MIAFCQIWSLYSYRTNQTTDSFYTRKSSWNWRVHRYMARPSSLSNHVLVHHHHHFLLPSFIHSVIHSFIHSFLQDPDPTSSKITCFISHPPTPATPHSLHPTKSSITRYAAGRNDRPGQRNQLLELEFWRRRWEFFLEKFSNGKTGCLLFKILKREGEEKMSCF